MRYSSWLIWPACCSLTSSRSCVSASGKRVASVRSIARARRGGVGAVGEAQEDERVVAGVEVRAPAARWGRRARRRAGRSRCPRRGARARCRSRACRPASACDAVADLRRRPRSRVGEDAVGAERRQRRVRALLPLQRVGLRDRRRVDARRPTVVSFSPATFASEKRTQLTAPTPGTPRTASASAGGVSPKPDLSTDGEVAGEGAVDGAVDRAAQPRGEDRHEGDERDADHQRGGGDRRARRVAGRVLAREPAASRPPGARSGAPTSARDRPHELRAEQRDAEEDGDRAAAERRRRAAARRAAEQAVATIPARRRGTAARRRRAARGPRVGAVAGPRAAR